MDVPPRRSRGAATRHDLLVSGARVFGRVGYVNAEVAMVIADASRGRGTFYLYFQDKADLLKALVDDLQSDFSGAGLSADQPFGGGPEDFLRLIWSVFKRHAATFRALVQAAAVDRRFDDLFRHVRAFARRDFEAMLSRRQSDRSRADIELLASLLETMMMHCMYDWLSAHLDTPMAPSAERRAFEILNAVIANVIDRGPPTPGGVDGAWWRIMIGRPRG